MNCRLKYVKERKAFGKEIMHHQAIQFKLADMATRIEAARLLCLKAAWEKDQHTDYTLSSSMAKVFAQKQRCGLTGSRADTWRIWLCKRIPCGTTDARCKDHADI